MISIIDALRQTSVGSGTLTLRRRRTRPLVSRHCQSGVLALNSRADPPSAVLAQKNRRVRVVQQITGKMR
jgi:hypothetical protein